MVMNRTAGQVRESKLPSRSYDTTRLSPEAKTERTSLTQQLTKQGKIKLTNDLKLIKARVLFVVELFPLKDVANELQLPLSTLQRWSHLHCWSDARAERELALLHRVQGVRRALIPNIDREHDEMFGSLEHLLGVTIKDLVDSGAPVPPHHLKTLASTLEQCQKGRRLVHKKEAADSRKSNELEANKPVFQTFVQSLVDLASRAAKGTELALPDPNVMDAEFEVMGDVNVGSDEEES